MKIRVGGLLQALAIAAMTAAGMAFFARFVPFAMDEFCQQHALAVHYYPLNMLNQFRESSTIYDLAPFGGRFLPLRSYWYMGSFSSVEYLPFFLAWPSPHSVRLMGFVVLAAQAFLLHRLFGTRWAAAYLALLLAFPYSFMHVVDTGTMQLQTTSILLGCVWARAWRRAGGRGWAYPVLTGLFVFIGVWCKLLYVVLVPGLAALLLYYLAGGDGTPGPSGKALWARGARFAAASAFTAAVPTLALLHSKTRAGVSYFYQLGGRVPFRHYADAHRLFSFTPDMIAKPELTKFFVDPAFMTHMVLRIDKLDAHGVTLTGFLLIASTLSILAYGIFRLRKGGWAFPAMNAALAAATYLLITFVPQSRSAHHVVLAAPFLVLAFFSIAARDPRSKVLKILFAVFFAANLLLVWRVAHLPYQEVNPPSKLKLNALLNDQFGRDHVIVVISYGMYYVKSLYGDPDQCVLYFDPFNYPGLARSVRDVQRKLNRKAVFVGLSTSVDTNFLKANFPRIQELKTDFDTGNWRVWYEP